MNTIIYSLYVIIFNAPCASLLINPTLAAAFVNSWIQWDNLAKQWEME